MGIRRLLVANRGEIAVRIIHAADELDIATTAVYAPDDAQSLHVARATNAHALTGRGAAAYLDLAQMIAAARDQGCDAIHPGYGFLAENPNFAAAARDAGSRSLVPARTHSRCSAISCARAHLRSKAVWPCRPAAPAPSTPPVHARS